MTKAQPLGVEEEAEVREYAASNGPIFEGPEVRGLLASLDEARAQAQRSRDETLEEAARLIDSWDGTEEEAAAAIRARKQSATPSIGEKIAQLAEHGAEAPYLKANPPQLSDYSATPSQGEVLGKVTELLRRRHDDELSDEWRLCIREALSLLATLRGGK